MLTSLLGTTYGAYGQLPDLRGEFIRGWVNNRAGITGQSATRLFGSWEVDEFKSHSHTFEAFNIYNSNGYFPGGNAVALYRRAYTTDATGGPETRPRNIALLPCIRALP